MRRTFVAVGLCLCLSSACGSQMTPVDAGVDSGVALPTMLTASDMLSGTVAAPKPTVGYDAAGSTGSFSVRQTAAGAFKADINVGFSGQPAVTTYTSTSGGFSCNALITSGTAAADTWTALFNQPPQMNRGSCSLTFSSVELGAGGYSVHGTLQITALSAGGASSGMVTVSGTF
jgi:hypothetical protein